MYRRTVRNSREVVMTTLEVKLNLPDQLAREAQAAGLLTSASISKLLKNAMRRRAAQALLAGARRAAKRGSKPMTLEAIQAEVNAVRRSRKADKRA
jgi:post-segregation antitoxin (ccd killing protein)